jgi:sugar lactone lactonase YvrE
LSVGLTPGRARTLYLAPLAGMLATVALLAFAASAPAATGTFTRAWGKDVISNGPSSVGFEVCAPPALCKQAAGSAGVGGDMSNNSGIATDPTGNVYVTDPGAGRVTKFSPTGDFLFTLGKDVLQGGTAALETCSAAANCKSAAASNGDGGEMNAPEGIAIDTGGSIYVVSRLGHRVDKFSPAGVFLRAWGRDVLSNGAPNGFENCVDAADCKAGVASPDGLGGELAHPNGIAIAGNTVFVADRVNKRIQAYSTDGAFLRTWGKDVLDNGPATGFEICSAAADCKAAADSTGLGGELVSPIKIAADGAGNVYVGDSGGSQVVKFAESGAWERTWGKDVVAGGAAGPEVCTAAATCKQGEQDPQLGGEFNQPSGIEATPTGVLVSDTYSHRIQEFDPAGRFFAAWGRDVVAGGAEVFELCTLATSCAVGKSGTLGGELQLPAGVTLAPNGAAYVADAGNRRIQQFSYEAPTFPVEGNPPPPKAKKCKKKKGKKGKKRAVESKKKKKKKKCKKKKRKGRKK